MIVASFGRDLARTGHDHETARQALKFPALNKSWHDVTSTW